MKVSGDLSVNYLDLYELRVEAYNPGPTHVRAVTLVRITVLDQNTHRPVFPQTHFSLQIPES